MVARPRQVLTRIRAGQEDPFFLTLLFDGKDELIGLYFYSSIEKPQPWRKVEDGSQVGSEHWGLYVYFKDPVRASGAVN